MALFRALETMYKLFLARQISAHGVTFCGSSGSAREQKVVNTWACGVVRGHQVLMFEKGSPVPHTATALLAALMVEAYLVSHRGKPGLSWETQNRDLKWPEVARSCSLSIRCRDATYVGVSEDKLSKSGKPREEKCR